MVHSSSNSNNNNNNNNSPTNDESTNIRMNKTGQQKERANVANKSSSNVTNTKTDK